MSKALGIGLIVVGAILLMYGFKADDSVSSEVSKFFTGSPTDKTMWYFIGGAASAVVGLVLTLKKN